MYARMTELRSTDTPELERDLRYFQEEILSRVEEVSGMRGGLILMDRDGHRATAITFWTDRDALERSREVADTLRQLAFQRMDLAAAPVVRECEVTLARLTQPEAGTRS